MECMKNSVKKYSISLAAAFLGAALVAAYTSKDAMMEKTRETGTDIHNRTIAASLKNSHLFNTTIPESRTESHFSLLSFSLRTVRREEQAKNTSTPIVCITETGGWRVPFSNNALVSSSSACSIGYKAASNRLQLNQPEYAFRY